MFLKKHKTAISTFLLHLAFFSAKVLAGENASGSPSSSYNSGVRLYQKNEFEKAKGFFQEALLSKSKSLEFRSSYNIGNTSYRMASLQEKNGHPQEALALLNEALDFYRRAIEINPKDADAKYNHEATEYRLKELSEKIKQRNAEHEPSESHEKDADKQAPQQSRNRQTDALQNESEEGKKNEPKEANDVSRDKKSAQDMDKSSRAMSKEEARLLVENFGREGRGEKLRKKEYPASETAVLKDW